MSTHDRSPAYTRCNRSRFTATSNGDEGALKLLREREARLERRRVKKNLFIQAVSDATDFQQVKQHQR